MTQFSYRAIDAEGRAVSGAIEAADPGAAERAILAMGLRPFETRSSGHTESWLTREIGSGPSLGVRLRFARMLATLLASGVPIDRALSVMAGDEAQRRIRAMARLAGETVAAGQPLSEAMTRSEIGFSPAEAGQVRAGEQTGKLPLALLSLANELERQKSLRDRIVSALVYPAILFVMAIVSLVVIATVLVPSLAPVFEQAGREPPLLLNVVQFTAMNLRWIGSIVLVLCALWVVLRLNGTRLMPEAIALAFPPLRQFEAARFCRTMGNLLGQGTNLQTAIRLTRDALKYGSSRQAAERVHEQVTSGVGLSAAAETLSFLDGTTRQLLRIGEETNQLPSMFGYAAASFETSATQWIERLMTLLTPLLTIVMGAMIGGLIMSVMRAIFSLNELVLQ